VFIAQHIWTGEGSFGTGSFGKIVANVPTALQALRFKPGILVRLSGVDMGYVERMCRFVILTGRRRIDAAPQADAEHVEE
jgi:hypothetical protein